MWLCLPKIGRGTPVILDHTQLQDNLGTVQLLAVHIPGIRNGVSDDLSRDGTEKAKAEATKAGFELEELPVPEHQIDWMRDAAKLPQH